MNQVRLRRSLAALLFAAAVVLIGVLGCQGIADIPDVSYSPTCNAYCDQIQNECTGPNKQYDDRQTCLETCLLLDKNIDYSTAKEGNTIPCRLDKVHDAAITGKALTDRASSCAQAGPGGAGACTSAPEQPDCEAYCALYVVACGGESSNPFQPLHIGLDIDTAGSQSDCIKKCSAVVPLSGNYNAPGARMSGDTLGCRLYFATKAVLDPKAYCDPAGLRPSGECLGDGVEPNCGSFCLALTKSCVDDLAVYEGPGTTQCEAVCNATAPGAKQATDFVNTVGCRTAHAFNALLVSATDHCPHIGPLGAGVCGSGGNCVSYCDLASTVCPDEFAKNYADGTDCADQCAANIPGADKAGYSVKEAKIGGNTVQCRGLALSRAAAATVAKNETARANNCAAAFGAAPCTD